MTRYPISNLNEIPLSDIKDLKEILLTKSETDAKKYLYKLVSQHKKNHISSFFKQVIIGDTHPLEWRRFNCKMFKLSVSDMLTRSIDTWVATENNKIVLLLRAVF